MKTVTVTAVQLGDEEGVIEAPAPLDIPTPEEIPTEAPAEAPPVEAPELVPA